MTIAPTDTIPTKRIDPFEECIKACERCIVECLESERWSERERCIDACRDAIDLCNLVRQFAVRESPLFSQSLALCATACRACADECAKEFGCPSDGSAWCVSACNECVSACATLGA